MNEPQQNEPNTNPTTSPSESKSVERWVEVGTNKRIRMWIRKPTYAILSDDREYSVDQEAWFEHALDAYKDGKAKECLIYASDVVQQDSVQAWLIGLMVAAQNLTPGTRLCLNRVGDQLIVTQEIGVLEPIFMSQLQEIELKEAKDG